MEISVQGEGVYVVHVVEGFDRFLETVVKLGIDVSGYMWKEYVWPEMTCVFVVDTKMKLLHYIHSPSHCAIMKTTGIRFWKTNEFIAEVKKLSYGNRI